MFAITIFFTTFFLGSSAFCNNKVSVPQINIEDVFGLWFGVGYAQHVPDLTNSPERIGCITIYINDVTHERRQDWVGYDTSTYRRNWSTPQWRSPHHNPFSKTPLSGSWMDYRIRNLEKRSLNKYGDSRLRVMWDEDGQSEEQTYEYYSALPSSWKTEQWRPGERELTSRGIEYWQPEITEPRPEYIYVLQSTPDVLVLHHCFEAGSRSFTLTFRRVPTRFTSSDWFDFKRMLYKKELPHVYRYTAVCAACVQVNSAVYIVLCILFVALSNNVKLK